MSGGLPGLIEVSSGLEVALVPVLDAVVVSFLKWRSSPSPEKKLRSCTGGFINEGV
jgi:hypothetical protein